MSVPFLVPASAAETRGHSRLPRRQLHGYPGTLRRRWLLTIAVAATVVLYYQLYVQYAMSTAILTEYHISYTYFVDISVIGNVLGAFGSLIAGLADRWGRASLTVYGLLAVGLLIGAGVPQAPNGTVFALFIVLVSLIEGMVVVTTPALVRDFSPQTSRATAMGFWTMGPVIGSLALTAVVSQTYHGATTWQDEMRFAAVGGLATCGVAFIGLRELSPRLRDQIMVSLRDRVLIEARARGRHAESLTGSPWRRMVRLDVVGPSIGISAFLLFYYSAVGSLTAYFATVFDYSLQRTAALLNWYWAANAATLLVAGIASDRLRVRKPIILAGAMMSAVFVAMFALDATRPATGYYDLAAVLIGIGFSGGLVFGPWMAGFTETVERHNAAATATGLAVFGWINRILVALSVAVLPVVVSSVTPLVEHGATVQSASVQAGPALDIIAAHQALFAELDAYPTFDAAPATLQGQARQEVGVAALATVAQARPAMTVLQQYGPTVQRASTGNARNWQRWWWVCMAAQLLFVPLVFTMSGRWSPRRAREDFERYESAVAQQTAALSAMTRLTSHRGR